MNDFLLFLDQHANLVGWPALLAIAWKASRFLSKFEGRMERAEETIERVATNHLPHLQASMDALKQSVDKGFDRLEDSLSNLGQSIVILAKKV